MKLIRISQLKTSDDWSAVTGIPAGNIKVIEWNGDDVTLHVDDSTYISADSLTSLGAKLAAKVTLEESGK